MPVRVIGAPGSTQLPSHPTDPTVGGPGAQGGRGLPLSTSPDSGAYHLRRARTRRFGQPPFVALSRAVHPDRCPLRRRPRLRQALRSEGTSVPGATSHSVHAGSGREALHVPIRTMVAGLALMDLEPRP